MIKQIFNLSKAVITGLLLLIYPLCFSQVDDGGITSNPVASNLVQVPNSPEAEAIIRYGNVPISYYTGKPNITVPIYTIEGREFSVPISLSYDASGIKVQSISSKVGAGWNLNAGGMVVREVVGLPDSAVEQNVYNGQVLSLNAYLNSLRDPEQNYYLNFENYEHTLENINKFRNLKKNESIGEMDLLPDIFHFNAPGLSGSIVIDPNTGDAYSINDPDIKVTYSTSGSSNEVNSWTITNASGNTYYFNRAEETTSTFTPGVNEGTRIYNSGWYLTKIISANHKDVFDFLYLNPQYWDQPQNYYNGQTSQADLSVCGRYTTYDATEHIFNKQAQASDYKIKQSALYAIEHNNEIMATFFNSTERLDLEGQRRLDKIVISSLKTVDFEYSYFTTESTPENEIDYRLRLDQIKMIPLAQGSSGPVLLNEQDINSRDKSYKLYYNTDKLPGRTSLAQDALGYYNGKGNTTLIPEYIYFNGWVFPGADRNPDFDYKVRGILTEIEYPTGGSTVFEYEKEISNNNSTTVERFNSGIGNIGSGEDHNANEDDYDCDDGFWHFPKTTTSTFTVGKNEIYDPEFTGYRLSGSSSIDPSTGEYNQEGRVFFMAIYKDHGDNSIPSPNVEGEDYIILDNGCIEIIELAADVDTPVIVCPNECVEILIRRGDLSFPFNICYDSYIGISNETNNKTFCELLEMVRNEDEDLMYSSYAVATSGTVGRIELPEKAQADIGFFGKALYEFREGDYKVFMMNSYEGLSLNFSRSYMAEVEHNDYQWKNDIKVKRIIDKTNEGEVYVKELDYLEESKKQYTKLHSINTTRDNRDGSCYVVGDYSSENGTFKTLHRYTTNQYAKTPHEYTYPKVKETLLDSDGNTLGSTVYEFYDQKVYTLNAGAPYGIPTAYNPKVGVPFIPNNPLNGQSKQITHYDKDDNIIKQEASLYDFESNLVTSGTNFYGDQTILDSCTLAIPSFSDPDLYTIMYSDTSDLSSIHHIPVPDDDFVKTCVSQNGNNALGGFGVETPYSDTHIQYSRFKTHLLETSNKEYFYDASGTALDTITRKSTYVYGTEHNLPIETIQEINNGSVINIQTQYPKDIDNPSTAEQELIARNQISIPTKVDKIIRDTNTNVLAKESQHTEYKQWSEHVILPKKISASIANETLEERVTYHSYSDSGNPLEVSSPKGMHIIYIWGYNEQYPIAKIDNASYTDMPSSILTSIQNIKTKSNTENSGSEETELRSLFENLRNNSFFANSMVTSYTYDPLVGVTSITDPKGYTTYYEYDGFQRLLLIRDKETNITDKYYYNYADEALPPLEFSINGSAGLEINSPENYSTTVTGGSGNFSYNWQIIAPSGTVQTSSTTNSIPLNTGTIGKYTIELTVTDTVTGSAKSISEIVEAYGVLVVTLDHPSQVDFNETALFQANLSGGSGNFSYDWKITQQGHSISYTEKSFNHADWCHFFGQSDIEFTITDHLTGKIKTSISSITIGRIELKTVTLITTIQSQTSTSQTFNIKANLSNGSGNYSYRWYVNGSYKSSGSSTSVSISCSGPSSAIVKCEIQDNCTGATSSGSQTYTINPSWCTNDGPSGPSGPSGGGNESDDSDNSKQ